MNRIEEIESRLRELRQEEKCLLSELTEATAAEAEKPIGPLGTPARATTPLTPVEKIALFEELFACRKEVFPKLWENSKTGKKGYSPACNNEWRSGVCEKPKVKCSECPNQAFPPLDSSAVRRHLEGIETIGTYAIRDDETSVFLAADFDGSSWKEDAIAFRSAASELGISVAVERSRSGEGAHAWILFMEPIRARSARQLGTAVMARASSKRHALSLRSYDRFFPNQDCLPKGGFGNLIALPLQKRPRENGNTVFLDEHLVPIADQWKYMASIPRLSANEVQGVLDRVLDTTFSLELVPTEDAEVVRTEKILDSGSRKVQPGCYPEQVEIHLGSQLRINLKGLPSTLIAAFKRTATFANPVFFEKQRLRFSTWNTPRFIFCGELEGDTLLLPRGTLDRCLDDLKLAGSQVVVRDERPRHRKLALSFHGELSPDQAKAVKSLLPHDSGVLVAPPGAGKTVMACAIIAKRRLPTLILSHRMPILEQWRKQLARFLEIPEKEIGVVGRAKKKITGKLDLGMLQTVTKLEEAEEILGAYAQIIIDECHHIPAVSFEAVLKKIPAQFVLGLTATPFRKDGHQAIIHMQCGPIRHEMKSVGTGALNKVVIVRETGWRVPENLGPQPPIHQVWAHLVEDRNRLSLLAEDIRKMCHEGRFPLVISDRKQHLDSIRETVHSLDGGKELKSYIMVGGLGKKARAKILTELEESVKNGLPVFLLTTGSFIGEGFDLPALDTLILAMPVSFRGRMIQYAGRLHRPNTGKDEVRIYDYVDTSSALTMSMFRKRMAAYRKMGYKVELPLNLSVRMLPKARQTGLFAEQIG